MASWSAAIVSSLKRTGYSSAPGPDGIRAAHLRQLLVVRGTGPLIADALAKLTDQFVRGLAHPFMDGVSLSMIRKPGGGYRPIGVGSILRRAPLRVVAERLRRDVGPILARHGQLGLVEAGPQRAFLRARAHLDARCTTLRLDVSNAFNAVSRASLMGAAQRTGDALRMEGNPSPALAAACLAYDRPTRVYVAGSRSFETTRGVIQGCPLGTILFDVFIADLLASLPAAVSREAPAGPSSLAAIPSVRPMACASGEMSYDPNSVHVIALHDDITLASFSSDLLPAVVRPLKALLHDAGLSLARGKSQLLSNRPVPETLTTELDASLTDAALFAGAPLFTERGRSLAEAMVSDKAHAVLDLMLKVTELGDPQDVVKITSLAGCWSRLQYLHSLTRELRIWDDILPRADLVSQALVGHALGAHARHTSSLSWAVALLPVARGGLGMKSCLLEATLNSDRLFRALETPDASPDSVLPVRQQTTRRRERVFADLAAHVHQAFAADPDALVRLKHQGLKSSANPWLTNASDRDGTLMQPKVAAKVLHLSLLAPPLSPGVSLPCGEAIHRTHLPVIGDDSLEHRVHLEACSLNVHHRHLRVVGALKKIADDMAPGHVKTEQAMDDWGQPKDAQRGELRPGDLTVFDGTHHLFLDFTASLTVDGVLKEAGPAGKFAICDDAFRAKQTKYAASFGRVTAAAKLLPFAMSGYGGSYYLSNVALSTFAKAVEDKATAPTPLGTTTLERRMLDAASVQVRAAAARHALRIEEQYDTGPGCGPDPTLLQQRPYPPFQASCPRAASLKASLERIATNDRALRASAPKAARAALLARILFLADALQDDGGDPLQDSSSDDDSDADPEPPSESDLSDDTRVPLASSDVPADAQTRRSARRVFPTARRRPRLRPPDRRKCPRTPPSPPKTPPRHFVT